MADLKSTLDSLDRYWETKGLSSRIKEPFEMTIEGYWDNAAGAMCAYGCWVVNTGDPDCPIHFPKQDDDRVYFDYHAV